MCVSKTLAAPFLFFLSRELLRELEVMIIKEGPLFENDLLDNQQSKNCLPTTIIQSQGFLIRNGKFYLP